MKKIVLTLNGHQFKTSSVEFACYLARLTESRLTGVFLTDTPAPLSPSFEVAFSRFHGGKKPALNKAFHLDADQRIHLFLEACERNGVHSDVLIWGGKQTGKCSPAAEAINESRYADLLVLDAEMSFGERTKAMPSLFAAEVVAHAECPVIMAPSVFNGINEIYFCYDGSRSSVFALKLFTYLIPAYTAKHAIVLAIKREEQSLLEKEKLMAWLSGYYSKIDFRLFGEKTNELSHYFSTKKNTFIVTGYNGKHTITDFIRRNGDEETTIPLHFPLFIARR